MRYTSLAGSDREDEVSHSLSAFLLASLGLRSKAQAELYDAGHGYTGAKARDEWYGEWGAALLYRPIALALTPLFIRLSIGATPVTLVSLVLALSLPAFALIGTSNAPVVAALGMAIGILDCLDGNIARATATTSRLGNYLDFLTDVVFRMTLYVSLGLFVEQLPVDPVWLPQRAFGLGVIAALLAISARLCRVYDELLTGARATAPPVAPKRASLLSRYVFPFISGIDSLTAPIMLLAYYMGGLGWLLLWLLTYSALDFLHTQLAILPRMR